ncbi:hypothetical protein DICPUDRAFT_91242 [Dictyostelium purpureum]|uniref:Peptidase A1 domain-containing protein n=1 Tax=Dictyostelium purpureum TaxID=5786 RepID=F0Z9P1_DICPU|nr:uncharacterized protein DICPUDRAFT_91242 [Dictyostelium purpureum]EGC39358.1 hypothetical protein DICPUDRAFT_91242 [Dictyostelium purpureum]|eukprot:XP_003284146.1 hypothetical protein DICPUDRAFT_91242 [Dictyostelium purpureum]
MKIFKSIYLFFIIVCVFKISSIECYEKKKNNQKPTGYVGLFEDNIDQRKSLVLDGKSDYLSSNIFIGSDPFNVIIDTTLNYLIVAERKCDGCSQFPPYYRESAVFENIPCDSPTCHAIGNTCEKPNKYNPPTCGYETVLQPYGANIKTILYRDIISIDDFKNIPVIISAIYEQSNGPSLRSAILGVGPSCPTCPPSPLQTLLYTLKKPYIFGISLDKNYFGGISIGIVDPLLYTGSINYTAMSKKDGLYSISPSIIGGFWNGQIFNLTRSNDIKRFILSSSSSLSYIPSSSYSKLKTFLKNGGCQNDLDFCSKIDLLFNSCVNASQISIDRFPNIDFYFDEQFILNIPPKNYFHLISRNNQVYVCMGILESPDQNAIIGINLMRELYTVFDNENSRIGFGRGG